MTVYHYANAKGAVTMNVSVIPRTVELYNADYRAIGAISWTEAVRMLLREAVHVVQTYDPAVHIHSPSVTIELPQAIVLRKYAHVPYREMFVTREGVLRRDKRICAYCGAKGDTIDHVLPRSRGGTDSWLNLVAACAPCNGRKSDRLPNEAGMKLRWEPYIPDEKAQYFLPND